MDVGIYVLGILIGSVIWGIITKAISNSRGCEGGFWWGFWLWVIGVIIVAVRPAQNTVPVSYTIPSENKIERLSKLNALRDKGIITQEEYEAKKKEIIG